MRVAFRQSVRLTHAAAQRRRFDYARISSSETGGRVLRAERARLLHLQYLCQDHLSPILASGRRTRMRAPRFQLGLPVFPAR
jgi:hypothetical protein